MAVVAEPRQADVNLRLQEQRLDESIKPPVQGPMELPTIRKLDGTQDTSSPKLSHISKTVGFRQEFLSKMTPKDVETVKGGIRRRPTARQVRKHILISSRDNKSPRAGKTHKHRYTS